MKISVNGLRHEVPGPTIDYEDVIVLAGFTAGRILSVSYCTRRVGTDEQREGIMHPGCLPVAIEESMLFDVGDTSNA